AALSGAELIELWGRRGEPDAIAPLLDRAISLALAIPGLPIARASQLAGKSAVAEGKVTGRLTLLGSPARPRLTGQVSIKDLSARAKRLGTAALSIVELASGEMLHHCIESHS